MKHVNEESIKTEISNAFCRIRTNNYLNNRQLIHFVFMTIPGFMLRNHDKRTNDCKEQHQIIEDLESISLRVQRFLSF